MSPEERGAAFRALHEGEPFVIPNPWDAGSAKVLASLGFRALATTSGGFAFTSATRRRPDARRGLRPHPGYRRGDRAAGLGRPRERPWASPDDAARAITGAAEAGAVGGSIEDWDREGAIYELNHAAERIAAAREAADGLGFPFTLTARAENFLHDNPISTTRSPAFRPTRRRRRRALRAGLGNTDQIRAISEATGKPLNVLARSGVSMGEIAEAGAQRVSVGSRFLWVAVSAMVSAAKAIRDSGDFSELAVRVDPDAWLG